MKIKKRRRPVLLLELMLALALFALLTAFLLSSYSSVSRFYSNIQNFFENEKSIDHCKQRLARLIAHIPIQTEEEKEEFYFFSSLQCQNSIQGQSLVFTYDNLLEPLSEFSSTQIARLYVNTEKQLCVTIWPALTHVDFQLQRTEVLLEHVQSLHFSFYEPYNLSKEKEKPVTTGQVTPISGWSSSWLIDYKSYPSLFQITLVQENGKILEWKAALPGAKNIEAVKSIGAQLLMQEEF